MWFYHPDLLCLWLMLIVLLSSGVESHSHVMMGPIFPFCKICPSHTSLAAVSWVSILGTELHQPFVCGWLLCCISFIPGCEISLNTMTYYGLSTYCDFIRWLLTRIPLKSVQLILDCGSKTFWIAVVCIYDKWERHSWIVLCCSFLSFLVFSQCEIS